MDKRSSDDWLCGNSPTAQARYSDTAGEIHSIGTLISHKMQVVAFLGSSQNFLVRCRSTVDSLHTLS